MICFKRFASILVCALLLFYMAITPYAESTSYNIADLVSSKSIITSGKLTAVIASLSGKPGDIIRLPISVKENSGFAGFSISVNYDDSSLQFLSAEKSGKLLLSEIIAYEDSTHTIFINYRLPKVKRLSDVYPNYANKENSSNSVMAYESVDFDFRVKSNGVIGYLLFQIKDNAEHNNPISFRSASFFGVKEHNWVEGNNPFKKRTTYPATQLTVTTTSGRISVDDEPKKGDDNSFSDLTGEYADYAKYVEYLAEKGIAGGVGDGKFAPEKNVKRGDFVKMLAGVAGVDFAGDEYVTDQFSDVASAHSYNKLIGWAVSAGVAGGYADKTFKIDNNITNEDMAVMVFRLAGYMKIDLAKRADPVDFADTEEISIYAREAVWTLHQAEIVDGSFFGPKAQATRADAAKMLALYMKLFVAQ